MSVNTIPRCKARTGHLARSIMIQALVTVIFLCASSYTYVHARPLAEIMVSGHIVFSVRANAPPFSFTDHEEVLGIDVDLGRKLGEQLGLKVRFNVREGEDGLDPAADVAMNVLSQPESGGQFIPYFTDRLAVVAAPENLDAGSIFYKLENGQIGVVHNSNADKALTDSYKRKNQQKSRIKRYRNFADLLEAFRSAKVALLLAPLSEAAVARRGAGRKVHIMNPEHIFKSQAQQPQPWKVGLRVGARQGALAKILQEQIAELRRTGAIAEIFAQYSVPYALGRKAKVIP